MHEFQNNLAQLFISAPLQIKGMLMLYPSRPRVRPSARPSARQIRVDFSVQFFRLGPFLSKCMG